jgi:ribosomal-protein-alanine N-acetyltransferase
MPDHLPFVVESMTLADLDDVMQIEQVSFSAPWSARAYRYEITENEYSIMLVVRPRRRAESWLPKLLHRLNFTGPSPVLGYGGSWVMVDEIHIATLAIHPRWRGLGLGELLLLSLVERGAEKGARRATLEVRVSNEVALGLYRKYGFEITATRRGYYTDNNEDAYIMVTPPLSAPGFRANLERHRAQLLARLSSEQIQPALEQSTG